MNGPVESTMHTLCISSHGNVYTFADTITDATLGCFQNFAINMLNACWCLFPILVVINTLIISLPGIYAYSSVNTIPEINCTF